MGGSYFTHAQNLIYLKNYKVVKSLNKYDLEHKLLKGSPLYLGDIPTYKVTLGEMADFGFTKMQRAISLLCMDDEDANKFLYNYVDTPSTFLYVFAIFMNECKSADNKQMENKTNIYSNSILNFLSLFFKKKVSFHQDYGFIIDAYSEKPYILNDSNYEEFRIIVKERNCLVDLNGSYEENPNNEITKKLLEKRKKLREKVRKAKQTNQDDEGLTMADLISIFAEAEHMPLQKVYDEYDIYQFNNQFNRLKIMDDFHVNIQALLAGVKEKDFKLQHWLTKITKLDN